MVSASTNRLLCARAEKTIGIGGGGQFDCRLAVETGDIGLRHGPGHQVCARFDEVLATWRSSQLQFERVQPKGGGGKPGGGGGCGIRIRFESAEDDVRWRVVYLERAESAERSDALAVGGVGELIGEDAGLQKNKRVVRSG